MEAKNYKILAINPGSTSTKVSYYDNTKEVFSVNLMVPEEITKKLSVWDQYEFREKTIFNLLSERKIEVIDAVVGRGGLLRPIKGGVYKINEKMINDAKNNYQGEHVSNLGCVLAKSIADKFNTQAFTVDPVSVDEFEKIAYYSGHPEIKRNALSHALNIHAVAYNVANKLNKNINQCNFVIAHLGGGISIAAVKKGCIIDVNDASSDGPFTPERTGGLPLQQFIEICFSGKYSKQEMKKFVMGLGGLKAYLGTSNASEVEQRINNGDNYAKEVYEAMAYQISKEIGAMSTVLEGNVDRIILTGGLANSKMLTDWIKNRVAFITKIEIVPGENEMQSMVFGVLRVLNGEENLKEY